MEPTIYNLQLGPPKGTKKPDWTPGPPYVRSIPVTASICLDFAFPDIFNSLPSRPSLILAPARTWHTDVSQAMWEQARARAEELGSIVLFCDAGREGVSGVAGNGMKETGQVGQGSWVRTIGIPYPFDERKSFYASSGDWVMGTIVWGLLCIGWVGEAALGHTLHRIASRGGMGAVAGAAGRGVLTVWRRLVRRERSEESAPLLS